MTRKLWIASALVVVFFAGVFAGNNQISRFVNFQQQAYWLDYTSDSLHKWSNGGRKNGDLEPILPPLNILYAHEICAGGSQKIFDECTSSIAYLKENTNKILTDYKTTRFVALCLYYSCSDVFVSSPANSCLFFAFIVKVYAQDGSKEDSQLREKVCAVAYWGSEKRRDDLVKAWAASAERSMGGAWKNLKLDVSYK